MNGLEELPAHLLHEKQYTPDLKQSDSKLNNSQRKATTEVVPQEKVLDLKHEALT